MLVYHFHLICDIWSVNIRFPALNTFKMASSLQYDSDSSDLEMVPGLVSEDSSSEDSFDDSDDCAVDDNLETAQPNQIEDLVKRSYVFHDRRLIERADIMSEKDFRTMFRMTRSK